MDELVVHNQLFFICLTDTEIDAINTAINLLNHQDKSQMDNMPEQDLIEKLLFQFNGYLSHIRE